MLANFTEYLQLLLWTFCSQKGEIALVCSKIMGGNTIALAIRTLGSQSDFAKEVARVMCNITANIGKQMQCAVDIKSLQPWSASVGSIPYMVVAETSKLSSQIVSHTALKWCVSMCRKIYVAPRMSSPWAAESSDMINNPGQTFNVFQHTGVGSEIR